MSATVVEVGMGSTGHGNKKVLRVLKTKLFGCLRDVLPTEQEVLGPCGDILSDVVLGALSEALTDDIAEVVG